MNLNESLKTNCNELCGNLGDMNNVSESFI